MAVVDADLFIKLAFSIGTLSLGGVFRVILGKKFDWAKLVGTFMIFFGAQTGMNIYMKFCLSSVVVDEARGWKGLPAGFFVTGAQQFMSFCIFWAFLIPLHYLNITSYWPKMLTGKELGLVCIFSVSFIMNIALNNFSLSLITITLNLIIRSCLPLSTFVAQNVVGRINGTGGKSINLLELTLMLIGVVCAAVAVIAKMEGGNKHSAESKNLLFGVVVCIVSLLAGSMNLVLAGVLGTNVKLDSLETTVYNALPATLITIVIMFTYAHPINWDGHPPATDFTILMEAWAKAPTVVYLALASGALALAYNTLQFGIVQEMSATHVAFAGNFNKACMVPLSFMTGMESLPPGVVKINLPAGPTMIIASLGSILAFAFYNMVSKGKGGGHGAAAPEKSLKSSTDSGDESSDEESSDDEERGA